MRRTAPQVFLEKKTRMITLALQRSALHLLFPLLLGTALAQEPPADSPANSPGKGVYDKACAACHAAPTEARVPTFAALTALPANQISDAMAEGGKMAPMAAALSTAERAQLIEFLTAGQGPVIVWTEPLACAPDQRSVDVKQVMVSSGFSVDGNQTRSLSAARAGLKAADMKNLEVAWAIGFPRAGNGTGAAIIGDTMFVNGGGRLAALDTRSGCAKWSIAANSRNTPTFGEMDGRKVVALAVNRGEVLVVSAQTGEKIWQANGQAEGNTGSIRGGVVLFEDKVIVPISASGVGAGARPAFECCVGHGAVVALSAKDGSKLWEYHTMPAAQYNGRVSSTGVKQRGPSGAPIWSIPLIDAKRRRVIVTTGENTSHPATETSDAVIALALDTGKEAWKFQAMPLDVWNMACGASKAVSGPNCPWNVGEDPGSGRDFDFGAGAMLMTVAGKDMVLAGQKSGDLWALDAESGAKLWNTRFGEGTPLGGVHWGITTDGERLFATINDPMITGGQVPHPGVYAVDLKTGKQVWGYDAKPNCAGERGKLIANCTSKYGFSAAPLTIDGAVVAATLGGEVMIFAGKTGKLLKTLDTIGPRATLNDIDGKGGSIDSHAISAGNGMLFINSGYGGFQQTAGNVLIAYRPKQK
jgi:polyvinyl alcohol dehydrogenase (cytochrome)